MVNNINPYDQHTNYEGHKWCNQDESGQWWWDNGWSCDYPNHPKHTH